MQVFLLLNELWLSVLNCNHMYKRPKFIVIFRHIYSMVQSPSWEACWFEASEEISRNPKAHYHTQSVPHLSLSCTSPIKSLKPHSTWIYIIILYTNLLLRLPSCLLPSSFPTKTLYKKFSSLIRGKCPTHLILLHFITHTIFCEQYKSFRFLLFTHMRPSKRPSVKGLTPCRRKGSDRRHVAVCCWYSSGYQLGWKCPFLSKFYLFTNWCTSELS
jgi:hypothetical protein